MGAADVSPSGRPKPLTHPSPHCPAHGTDEALIGCPCNHWQAMAEEAGPGGDDG